MFNKFIHRPVLAIVLSLVIIFMGVLAISGLSTSQFPEIAPPTVIVRASYPGASAKVLTESVLIPLEQAVNGVPGMTYMSTVTSNDGLTLIQVLPKLLECWIC